MGVRDEDLFEEMASDALETAYQILENSHRILDPQAGYPCPKCQTTAVWEGRWQGHRVPWKSPHWVCPTCGTVIDWDELYEGEEMYTEQEGKLANIIGHLEYGNKDREAWFEILLQFVHGSGPMARFYIEGGSRTLSEVTLDQTRLEQVFWREREPKWSP